MPKNKPGECYLTVKPLMRTYDLLLFRGSDVISGLISRVERLEDGEESPDFTHVGCVILGRDLLPITRVTEQNWLRADGVYVFESTLSGELADGTADVTDRARLGVQLRNLDDVVETYDRPERSRLAWAPLRQEVKEEIGDPHKTARAEYEKYKGLSYDASVIDLAAAANVPGARCMRDCSLFAAWRDLLCCCCCGGKRIDYSPGSNKRDNDPSNWQFCSELVANVYKDLGIMPQNVVSANVIPVDFVPSGSSTIDADRQVPLVCMPFVRFHG